MKKVKKMLALVIALAMVLGTMGMSVLAETPTNNQTADASISVTGLEQGDSVQFIQVIKWVDGTGWAYVDGLEAPAGSELPTLTTITGDTSTTPVTEGTISAEHAAILAKAAVALTNKIGTTKIADSEGKAEYSGAAAGLYYACVTPATADYLYNTIFVGADFKSNDSNTIAANEATVGNASNAVAKKEQITLDKESMPNTADNAESADNIKYDHDLGEVIDFKITSTVPAFADGYVNPKYEITDALESGLELTDDDINVTIANVNLETGDYAVTKTDANNFKVEVLAGGIAKVKATGNAQTITVTYKAKITSLENATVTEKTNNATVKFSNKPTDESSYSLLEDKTRHYSFSLDASLLGKDGNAYTTDELIKVALGPDGQPVTETKEYHSGTIWNAQSPLQGAVFALFTENPQDGWCVSQDEATNSGKLYNNGDFTGFVTSDANGRLSINGLDANTNYYLREITAPAGYIKDNRTFTITIDAIYKTIPAGSYLKDVNNTPDDTNDDITVNYNSYKVLDSYTVHVNDGTDTRDSVYSIASVTTPVQEQKVSKAEYQTITGENAGEFAGDVMTPISNTQGTALPSTGGIGTTIFYTVGAILVIGAGVVLITRRRMNQ